MKTIRTVRKAAGSIIAASVMFTLTGHGEALGPANCAPVYEWTHYTPHYPFGTSEVDHTGEGAQPTTMHSEQYISHTPNQYNFHISLRHNELGYEHIINGEQAHQGCND